ncbi:MAG: DUF1007 family protein [Cucumibacter sp.]
MIRFAALVQVLVLQGIILCIGTLPALAHPHIWVDATAEIVFNAAGEAVVIRHKWLFDEAYSAWAVQGLDADGDGQLTSAELQPLADDNMVGLAEYGFFTFGSTGTAEIGFYNPINALMRYESGVLELSFELAFTPPAPRGSFELEVGDPEYYAAFSFQSIDAVKLSGAPAGCLARIEPPREIDPGTAAELLALPADITTLPPDLRQAARQLSNLVDVACPGAPPVTASQAIDEQVRTTGTPFVAPPAEPGGRPNQGGLLGWVALQQQTFYLALTDALSGLKIGSNAFWILGLLSFLYGIFHAAGPGHGKLVISSYVVAREREIVRGVALSFAAAFVQSLTAVVFILAAAGVLRLTSFAMSDAAGWLEKGSYALIAALGAWLVWRKLRSLLASRDQTHHHDHEGESHGHQHVITPTEVHGNWREAVGIVLAVGLRPCSGALIVLAFALAQDLLLVGIAATFVMGLGTALTVSVLAGFAVLFKGLALRAARGGNRTIGWLVSLAELGAAITVFGFGIVLLMASLA